MKTFDGLFEELSTTAQRKPDGSRTVELLGEGIHAIGKKVVEEASEVWMAAEHENDDALAAEISQLLYHVQVLMIARKISLEDVYRTL